MTYIFKSNPVLTGDKQIYTVKGGAGEVLNGELTVSSSLHTFVYKDTWFMRNNVTKQLHRLDVGTCPTLELTDIKILDKEYFDEITFMENEEGTI